MHLRRSAASLIALAALIAAPSAGAEGPDGPHGGFLARLHRNTTLTSTVPGNGDQNPYAVVVVPATVGSLRQGDVLVDNFNNAANLQGLGTTIIAYRPASQAMTLFAALPRHLAGCPGGVGLGTAMAVLRSGWVIVGSAPSEDGTAATKGPGCLIVLDAEGHVAGTLAGAAINDPWGNMAVIDRGESATLFVSNVGFDIGPPAPDAPVVARATVLRLDLAITPGKPPAVTAQTVIASGFGAKADKDVFLIGPTGLALAPDGTLYVSDAIGNRITAIADAPTRPASAGTGRDITRDGLLKRPLALVLAPNGHLVATNALDGQAVEIDPHSGRQIGARWLDADRAQTPPGSGDLFGLALTPGGDGLYYVEDDMNTLVLAR